MNRLPSLFALACSLSACAPPAEPDLQGYVEGEYVFVAAPAAGRLEMLSVKRGDPVGTGTPLYALERQSEEAAVAEARARVAAAQARLANLGAARRSAELDAIRAQVVSAKAARDLSATQAAQQERLRERGFVSEARVDEAHAALERDRARLAEADAQLRNARQSIGRDAELEAARAEAKAAQAQLDQSEWRLGQRAARATVAGVVQDTFFSEGEWVPAGAPIVSLLPPGQVKARFFVPETALGSIRIGQKVSLRCDGCGADIPATVSFISREAEYTPPVIFSRETRSKLVFMVEAKPDPEAATRLHPGQPLDVRLGPR